MGGRYTKAEKLAAIQRCAAETGKVPLRHKNYGNWYRMAPDRRLLPSANSVGPTAPDFVALCEEAGIAASHSSSNRDSYVKPGYTRPMLLDVVRVFVDDIHPAPPTRAAYSEWREVQARHVPVDSTLLNRFGSWASLMDKLDVQLPPSDFTHPMML